MLGYGRVPEYYPNELPRMVRDAGYYTLGIGKMHWFPQRTLHGFHKTILDESSRVESEGFMNDYRRWMKEVAPDVNPDVTGLSFNDYRAKTYQLPEEYHPTAWTGRTAVEFLENYDRDEPFFLKVSFARPHSPYEPPERLLEMYEEVEVVPARQAQWSKKYAKPRGGNNALQRRLRSGTSRKEPAALLREYHVHRRTDRQDIGGPQETRLERQYAHHLHCRSRRHAGGPQPLAERPTPTKAPRGFR